MSIWQRLSWESPIPADHRTVAQFPVQVETKKGDLKMPVMSLLSKHIYFRKEDNWRQLEGICFIIKINIYIEIQLT